MCLAYDGQGTRKYRQEWKKSGVKTRKFVKKVSVYSHGSGYSVKSYFHSQHRWTVGENNSDRSQDRITREERRWDSVYEGIHVYMRNDVHDAHSGGYGVPIEVEANVDDLVAVGWRDEAVFTKVRLTQTARLDAIAYAVKHGVVQ